MFRDNCLPIVEAGQALLVDDDYALDDTITLTPTPGHSPCHCCVNIFSRGQRASVTGDMMHHAIQCRELDWSPGVDWDPKEAAVSRRRFLSSVADTDTLLMPIHFPSPTAGLGDGGWRSVPLPVQAGLGPADDRVASPYARRRASVGGNETRMSRIDSAINIDDLRRMAKRRLPKIMFDFIEGGVEDEVGLRTNANAFRDLRLVPRYYVDTSKREQRATLFGRTYASPFGIAPTGMAGAFRRDAELYLAQAAAEADVPYLMSGASNASMEQGAKLAGRTSGIRSTARATARSPPIW